MPVHEENAQRAAPQDEPLRCAEDVPGGEVVVAVDVVHARVGETVGEPPRPSENPPQVRAREGAAPHRRVICGEDVPQKHHMVMRVE